MELATRETMFKERNTVKDALHGLTAVLTLASSLKIISREWEYTTGVMEGSTMDSGGTTKWKEEVYSHGQMAESMKVNTSTIKRRETETSTGQTEGSTQVNGRTESSTVLVSTHQPTERQRRENGSRERDTPGSTNEKYRKMQIYKYPLVLKSCVAQ